MVKIKNVAKLIIFSFLIGCGYYSLLILIEYILVSIIPLEHLISEEGLQKFYLIEYSILFSIVCGIFFFVKDRLVIDFGASKNIGIYFCTPVLAILTRIINDPIQRFAEINGTNEIVNNFNVIQQTDLTLLIILFKTSVLVPIIEEVVFRGFILGKFSHVNKNRFLGVLISAVLFSLIHDSPKAMFSAFNIGIVAGILYLRYGLISAILFHSFYNLIWFYFTVNLNHYWTIIKWLNFDLCYWLMITAALIGVITFTIIPPAVTTSSEK